MGAESAEPRIVEAPPPGSSLSPRTSARSPGVLLIQLGTPDAPTAQALRPYLRQFLGDPRVIEMPGWLWWPILQWILLRRPAASAAKYRRIWDPITGSPLLHWTRRQTERLQQVFPGVPVRFGMQVGNPPVAQVLDEMIKSGIERLIVLPMYPQYSATTTASATDVLFARSSEKAGAEARARPLLRAPGLPGCRGPEDQRGTGQGFRASRPLPA